MLSESNKHRFFIPLSLIVFFGKCVFIVLIKYCIALAYMWLTTSSYLTHCLIFFFKDEINKENLLTWWVNWILPTTSIKYCFVIYQTYFSEETKYWKQAFMSPNANISSFLQYSLHSSFALCTPLRFRRKI